MTNMRTYLHICTHVCMSRWCKHAKHLSACMWYVCKQIKPTQLRVQTKINWKKERNRERQREQLTMEPRDVARFEFMNPSIHDWLVTVHHLQWSEVALSPIDHYLRPFSTRPHQSHQAQRQEEEILGFQIPVADLSLVHVENCAQHLLHDDGRILLSELTHFDDSIEQLTSCAQLHRLRSVAGPWECLSILLLTFKFTSLHAFASWNRHEVNSVNSLFRFSLWVWFCSSAFSPFFG